MKRKLFAGISVGVALCIGAAAVTIPAFIINSSVPSISHARDSLIRGEAFNLQGLKLPQYALLKVQLIDITDKNNSPRVIAETKIKSNEQTPIAFGIPIKDDLFEDGHNYALQARITVGDTLWFVSDPTYVNTNETQKNYRVKMNSVRQNDTMMEQSDSPIDRTITNSILKSPEHKSYMPSLSKF